MHPILSKNFSVSYQENKCRNLQPTGKYPKAIDLPILFLNENTVPLPVLQPPLNFYNSQQSHTVNSDIRGFLELNDLRANGVKAKDIPIEQPIANPKAILDVEIPIEGPISGSDKTSCNISNPDCIVFEIKPPSKLSEKILEKNAVSGEPSIVSTDESKSPTKDEPKKVNLAEDNSEILKPYLHSVTFESSKGPRRRKRTIYCKYPECDKVFFKTWNFVDHARMHLGIKPYECKRCDEKFTQKGNLKKHLKKYHKHK
ncbi:unnamed protein product [Moneuplotes crassus]|uniref:C2H2-type domain-containing protein n=1 Tax=Euplotes crassus TaxID=5936 RepID=A0AAD1XH62_EUPCR|nr:unnamed protein product [Moneuplotes crassus]